MPFLDKKINMENNMINPIYMPNLYVFFSTEYSNCMPNKTATAINIEAYIGC